MQPSIENIWKRNESETLVDFESGQAKSKITYINTQFLKIEIGSQDFRQTGNEVHVVVQRNNPPARIGFPQDRDDNFSLSVQCFEQNPHGFQFQILHRLLGHLHSLILG